ncbi:MULTISPECIES: 4-hydroxy-tetrahydrodipicolinate synthase [unclassified Sphingopyxis]|jgi:4-hydroxy-tetrahydrodipicolinate synthase|uniref:4-hydroxy-tetrahydrodipicolinate synthase n=1 Tax=unclassified Sphingopyxis TaxID=2614943 RepID=UPI0007312775|nr:MULTISPECIES: 4-hydroxy-tetrahydrodipicolinate synthase [unclassified Sphingopyxis]KTE25218.1 4-hydroxy-tetrahydrodipicolinate synthase [Sphingopyxis sp. H057]KTE53788.1 4-hydroxy-tetrahydrodipicolinate synthase [Sphingopyxis sp. H073]KTE55947.1 4-hydroxy-tetrahydrodipicolinate synthase [Sphingopyxis sp. H107]KTE56380.1 4-hydroxy-tetrahydrodipicolinate synthase [Sphingopyxis sp. H071]KTE67345.1 4-hydroxy-tetrahydrodipicolinate synthase [Sphingopyxis sp. H100]
MFSGSIPALVTPFRDGAFDAPAFKRLVEWQIDEGTSALVPCGTTGESPTLGFEEHYRVIDACLEAAAGRVPVIAGCGSNDTATAIRHMRYAKQAGAAAALVVAPYYNKPSQDGMIAHYRALADACDLPIVVYNVPGRTVADISAETMCQLAEIPTVVAIKDASGDLARVTVHRAGAGADFCQLSGNDDLWLPHAVLGGAGCISVTANVAPRLCADFAAACAAGDWAGALVLHDRLFSLHKAMFSDSSPAPAKYALSRIHDWFSPEVRLPIIPASEASRAAVDAALVAAGVL